MVDIKDLNVGDTVVIVPEWVADEDGHEKWNHAGEMDRWLGKTMTVGHIYTGGFVDWVEMPEDKDEFGGYGWRWFSEMIDYVETDEQQVEVQLDVDILSLF